MPFLLEPPVNIHRGLVGDGFVSTHFGLDEDALASTHSDDNDQASLLYRRATLGSARGGFFKEQAMASTPIVARARGAHGTETHGGHEPDGCDGRSG